MRMYFKCVLPKGRCGLSEPHIGTATFRLKSGSTVTIDRQNTEFTMEDSRLSMDWSGCYIWKIDDVCIYSGENELNSAAAEVFNGAQLIGFNLEDEAPADYVVKAAAWGAYRDTDGNLYGVTRNYQGLRLDRCLYTLDQLREKDSCFPGGEPVSYAGAFRADNTYTVERLESEEAVHEFVTGVSFHECDYEDPMMIDLAEWYSDFYVYDIFENGSCINPTSENYLLENGLKDADLMVVDDRFTELQEKGYSDDFFYDFKNRERRYSEVAA